MSPKTETILIASDHAGFVLKEKLKAFLEKMGLGIKDLGPHHLKRCDYPLYAYALAKAISEKRYARGILICRTGIGNAIVANRLPGVRAALCYSVRAARPSREHNDSNVLVLGSAFVNERSARRITAVWLRTKFASGRHKRRLNQIKEIEHRIWRDKTCRN